jgi:16S rRNA (cytosine1402-N4)-methyltransferase
MCAEVIAALRINGEGTYLDATVGLGGHSEAIAKRLKGGRLICVDKDGQALRLSEKRLSRFGSAITFLRCDFRHIKSELERLSVTSLDGCVLDIGVSSLQFDEPSRGFSYRHNGPLDMRMDTDAENNARAIVNGRSEEDIADIILRYGQERHARLLAKAIVKHRPIDTTAQLADIILSALPAKARRQDGHPAKKTFQALRIAVNDELTALERALGDIVALLSPSSRVAVVTFHSLEDRLVKNIFTALSAPCVCPPSFPACVCGGKPALTKQTRQTPGEAEILRNPRVRSATLRYAEKLR